jgi:ATP-dependent RNA helicase DDX35
MSFQRPGSLSKSSFGVKHNQQQQQQQQPLTQAALEPPHNKRPRLGLPVENVRRQILFLVETHATVVVIGETGCGKTTQIPRFLHEAGWTANGYQARVVYSCNAAAARCSYGRTTQPRCHHQQQAVQVIMLPS